MMDVDLAWAAGLFEGEGCFTLSIRHDSPCVSARLHMTDEDVVRRFHRIVVVGSVRGPVQRKPGCKPTWEWLAQKETEVSGLIDMFWPYLGDRRRERAMDLLEALAARKGTERELGKLRRVA